MHQEHEMNRPIDATEAFAGMMYIKTMTNSWFTSRRRLANAGESKLNWILGCEDCEDDLSHYLQCHVIWCLVCSAVKRHDGWTLLDGIDRIAFPVQDQIHIYAVCVMFKCYHAIPNDYAVILDGCIAHDHFSKIHSTTMFWARHFATRFLWWLNELNRTQENLN